MKKIFILILISSVMGFAQEEKPLKLFKIHPINLASGTLQVSQEFFSKDLKKSTAVALGIRYINKKAQNTAYNSQLTPIDQYNKWQGANINIERRFYIPGFYKGDKYSFLNKNAQYGSYFFVGSKFDYNTNDFDKSNYYQQDQNKWDINVNKGKINYLAVMPNLGIGAQFTLLENLYIDIQLGGAIRFIKKDVKNLNQKGSNTGYEVFELRSQLLENSVLKEGVTGFFGFGLGLKL